MSNPSEMAVTGATPTAGLPLRWLKAFGRFWWDFLVGDTPELFVATVVILGVTAVLVKVASAATAAWVLLPVMVIAAITWSVLRGRRRRP